MPSILPRVPLGSVIAIGFGILAILIGILDIIDIIVSSPPAYLIVVGLLLIFSEYEKFVTDV